MARLGEQHPQLVGGDEGVGDRLSGCQGVGRHQAAVDAGAEQTAGRDGGRVALGEARQRRRVVLVEHPDRDLGLVEVVWRCHLVELLVAPLSSGSV